MRRNLTCIRMGIGAAGVLCVSLASGGLAAQVDQVPSDLPVAAPKSSPDIYDSLKNEVSEFENRFKQINVDMRRVKDDALDDQRKKLARYYDQHIDALVEKERAATRDAIVALERFIEHYPDNAELTPNAMLTLGELYFVEAETAYFAQVEAATEMSAARPDFRKAIALYEKLIKRFGSYRSIDAAYYLLGICNYYDERIDAAVVNWQELVEKFPKSPLADEVWFRIGDERFTDRQFDLAIAAYLNITANPNSAFYDRALYKLSWAYYIVNRYDEAIAGFIKVLDYRVSLGPKEGQAASVLESESEQYLAISFADKDWQDFESRLSEDLRDQGIANVDAFQDYFAHIGRRDYERKVAMHLGDVLLKLAKHLGAERAFLYAIALDPLHPQNPELSERIVKVFEDAGMTTRAMEARKAFVQTYMPGSAWEKAATSRKQWQVLHDSRNLVRDNLFKLAVFLHGDARRLKAEGKLEEAKAMFQETASYYSAYVQMFPEQDDVDKVLYFVAESSFDAEWYADSASAFVQTRDWPWKTEYRRRAAINAVFAYHKQIEQEQARGVIPAFSLTSIQTDEKARFTGEPHPLLLRFVSAVDDLAARYPDAEELPAFLFGAAGVFYAYGNMIEANRRFEQLVAMYPKLDVARFAANLFLEHKLAQGKWSEAAADAARFKAAKIGGSGAEFEKIEIGARFKEVSEIYAQAEQNMGQGQVRLARAQFVQASDRYLALLRDDPKNEFADKMLYNAGISLDLAGRSSEAQAVFDRLHKEHPKSPLAERAMLQRATQFEGRLEFDQAALAYLRFAALYPKVEQSGDAYLNAAILYEAQQKFTKAAEVFEQFGLRYSDRPEAADSLIRASKLYGKANDFKNKTRVLATYIKKYRGDSTRIASVVEADVTLADAFAEEAQKAKGDARKQLLKQSRQAYLDALALSKKDKDSPKSIYYASKAEFKLLEDSYKEFAAMKINASKGKTQGKQLTSKTTKLAELKKGYENIVRNYGESEWTIASLYQIGALYEGLFRAMLDAPCPTDVAQVDESACDEYRSLLEDKGFVLEEKAVDAFKLAHDHGGKIPDASDWVFRSEDALHRMRPSDYAAPDRPLAEPIVGLPASVALPPAADGSQS